MIATADKKAANKKGIDVFRRHQDSTMTLGRWIALLWVVALLAAACGSENDDASNQAGGTAIAAEASANTGDAAPTAGGGDGAEGQSNTSGDDENRTSTSADSTASGVAGTDGLPDASEPQYGGTLVVGLEAETTNGLNPVSAQAAVSGHIVFRALYDTLTIEGEDGQILPNLLKSFSSNDDFTEWTLTLRPGIFFHDGTPADAAALKRHFEAQAIGNLTRVFVSDWDLQSIEVLDDVSIQMVFGRPYSAFPNLLTNHLGYFGAPAMHDLGTQEAARNPIGTGPFMLDRWVVNEVTRVVRNPNYWRTDAEGRSLPYLDAIEFRPIPDTDARYAALRSGDLDASSANARSRVDDYDENLKTYPQKDRYAETTYLLLNNSRAPFDTVVFRRALAQCIDRQTYSILRWDGQAPDNGPFSPGTPGYLEDTGFPRYDPEAGSATIARLGISSVELGTTNDTANLLSTELIARWWGECGLDVKLTQVDQAELITNAAFGNFAAFLWRQHEGFGVATERVWWHSKFSRGLALNFGRIKNPAIDAALDEALTTTDPERQRELAEDVNRAFGEGVHHIWFYNSNWVFATHDHVHGVDNLTLDGGAEHEKVFSGRVFLTETWIEQ